MLPKNKMTKKEYNGWYNYETWLVNLWMDNEQGSQDYWREMVGECRRTAKKESYDNDEDHVVRAVADCLKNEHEEALPELNGFAADLLNAAMSEVNWHEIATHLVENNPAE